MDVFCHHREEDWLPPFSFLFFLFSPASSLHGDSRVAEKESARMWKQHTQIQTHTHTPAQTQEMFCCCQNPRRPSMRRWAKCVILHVSRACACLCSCDQDMISCPLNLSLHPSQRKMTCPAGVTRTCDQSISQSISQLVNKS